MIYVTLCPKCHEMISFLNNEDTKVCKKCGEVVYNTNKKYNEENKENITNKNADE
jgi:uncharacterized membrane protein YvbJ